MGCNRQAGTVQELQLSAIQHMPSLQQLAAACLPPGVHPSSLRSLKVFISSLHQPALLNCPFLGQLTSLTLDMCRSADGGPEPVVEALLQQAPQLRSLSLLGCFFQHPLPAALINRTGLKHLCLQRNGLTELPPGPYLSSESSAGCLSRCACTGLKSTALHCAQLRVPAGSWAALPPAGTQRCT